MDTIKERKSLENKDCSPEVSKQTGENESERLSEIFQKYKVEQYFWRNYKETQRIKSLALILSVTTAAILITVLLCRYIFLP